jgi:SAM-dependent methyltransferase
MVEWGGLKPDDRVLDVGCGSGRVARPLTTHLTSGRYDGLDIVRDSIDWCRRAYRPFPNFRFHHADLFNRAYNPSGSASAAEYRFPFDDGSSDFVVLTSVFTHMLPGDARHYLREIARLLAPGGRIFLTAFLLDEAAREGIERDRTPYAFSSEQEGFCSERPDIPESALAYDRTVFAEMVASAGLRVTHFSPGSWRGIDGATFQDLLLLRAASPRGTS